MLPTGLGEQMVFCLRFGLLGLALGAVYEMLRAIRTHFRIKKVGTALLDILFCLIGLLAFLLSMLLYTDGRLRGYLLLGLATGFWLWRKTVSRYVLRLLLWVFHLLGQAVGEGKAWVLWLFSFPRGN